MTTSSERRGVAIAALVSGLTLGSVARAQPVGESAAAASRALFVEGRELVQAGKCEEALPKFQRALALLPSGLGALRNIATCEERLERYVAARRDLRALRAALAEHPDAKYAGWDEDAAAALPRVESKIARLSVRVTGAVAGVPAVIRVDGEPVDAALAEAGLERDPGPHAVDARVGAATARLDVTLAPGAQRSVVLALAAGGPVAVRPEPRTRFWVGVVGLSVGGAAIVGAGIAAGVYASALSTIESKCPSHQGCDPSLRAVHDRAAVAGPLALGLGIGGGAAAAGGLFLLLGRKARPAVSPGVAVVDGAVFLTLQGTL